MTRTYYNGAHGALVVVDASAARSPSRGIPEIFKVAAKYTDDLNEKCSVPMGKFPIGLCINKMDLVPDYARESGDHARRTNRGWPVPYDATFSNYEQSLDEFANTMQYSHW